VGIDVAKAYNMLNTCPLAHKNDALKTHFEVD
jgi:hypothetical protein